MVGSVWYRRKERKGKEVSEKQGFRKVVAKGKGVYLSWRLTYSQQQIQTQLNPCFSDNFLCLGRQSKYYTRVPWGLFSFTVMHAVHNYNNVIKSYHTSV